MSRKQLLHFTAILQVELIGMEACDAGVLPASFFVNRSQESPFPMTHTMSALSELSLPSRARNGLGDIAALPLHNLLKLSRFVSEIPLHRELQQPRAIQRIDDKQRAKSLPRDQVAVLVWDLAVSAG